MSGVILKLLTQGFPKGQNASDYENKLARTK